MDYSTNRVIVTGGTGFIGSHLVDRLVQLGSKVTVITRTEPKNNSNSQAKYVQSDIRDFPALKDIIARVNPQTIFHLAASVNSRISSLGWNDPVEDYQINTLGTLGILMAVDELNIAPRIVYLSTAHVYGDPEYTPIDEKHVTNPTSPYGVSKLNAEKYGLAFNKTKGVKINILRLFHIYGPRQYKNVMFDLMTKLKDNPDTLEVIGTGNQLRDFLYISDVVDAILLVANEESTGEIYNVGGGVPISIRELAEEIVKVFNLESRTNIIYTDKTWEGDIPVLFADISKARKQLNFIPKVSLEEGLRRLKGWFDGYYLA